MTLGRPNSSLSLPMKRLFRRLVCGGNAKGDRHKLKRDVQTGKGYKEKLFTHEDSQAVEQVAHRLPVKFLSSEVFKLQLDKALSKLI